LISDSDLKHRLGLIITQEQEPGVDWAVVSCLCAALARDIGETERGPVKDYLGTSGRRKSDFVFAHAQRSELISYLRSH
jgi:hypothetical protein